MAEAVTPPNPDQSDAGKRGNPPQITPDPTLMTIDALRREIAMLENLFDTRFSAVETLMVERFRRIDALMDRAEEMRQEQKSDTKSAVDAALSSQKEATAKMEVSVSEQLSALRENFEVEVRSVSSSVADLKDRMTVQEAVKQGQSDQRSESRQVSAGVLAVIGVGVAFLMALLALISFMAGGS